jgi:hypothetical protein
MLIVLLVREPFLVTVDHVGDVGILSIAEVTEGLVPLVLGISAVGTEDGCVAADGAAAEDVVGAEDGRMVAGGAAAEDVVDFTPLTKHVSTKVACGGRIAVDAECPLIGLSGRDILRLPCMSEKGVLRNASRSAKGSFSL